MDNADLEKETKEKQILTDEQITLNASQYCDTMNDKNEDIRLIRFASYIAGATTTKDIIEKEVEDKIIVDLKVQIEQLQKVNNDQKETLKKVRVALIQERAANLINYGKGGVEMFDNMFEILKGVSN